MAIQLPPVESLRQGPHTAEEHMATLTGVADEQAKLAAFDAIVAKLRPALVKCATKVTWSHESGEDAAQEALAKLWECTQTDAQKSDLQLGWLFTVNLRKAIDTKRKENGKHKERAAYSIDENRSYETAGDTTSEAAIGKIAAQGVLKVIDELPPGQRETILLNLLGYSNTEVGEQVGASSQAIDNRRNRAIKTLRLKLKH